MTGRDLATKLEIQEFLELEAILLDERRFGDWLDLYTEDAVYWVPVDPRAASPMETLSIFFDTRQVMQARIRRLTHDKAHAQKPASRTCHLLSAIRIVEEGQEEFTVASNLAVVEHSRLGQRVFAGKVEHVLKRQENRIRIYRKRIDLINSDSNFEGISIIL